MKKKRFLFIRSLIVLTIFLLSGNIHAQQNKVTGKVVDAKTNTPLPGVNVTIEGTTTGTVTDLDGSYSLVVADPNSTLLFSFVGYTTESEALGGRTLVNVSLTVDITKLDEVVVIGYGTQKRSDLTGSLSVVSSEEMKNTQPMMYPNCCKAVLSAFL